jgi:hypothetical protein
VRVAAGGLTDDFAVQIRQRGEQGQSSVSDIVVGRSANVAHSQWQSGLRSLQRLALALLIATENQGLLWRIQIQSDDVPELRLEVWIP